MSRTRHVTRDAVLSANERACIRFVSRTLTTRFVALTQTPESSRAIAYFELAYNARSMQLEKRKEDTHEKEQEVYVSNTSYGPSRTSSCSRA